jgi:hypothetical protein
MPFNLSKLSATLFFAGMACALHGALALHLEPPDLSSVGLIVLGCGLTTCGGVAFGLARRSHGAKQRL